MNLAYSTNAFTHFPLKEALGHIKDIGFKAVEIVADEHPGLLEEGLARQELLDTLSNLSLAVANINANTAREPGSPDAMHGMSFLSSNEEALRRRHILYAMKAIDLAVITDSPCISITSGPAPQSRSATVRARESFVTSLHEILDYAGRKGIKVGIEYEPGLLISRAEDIERILVEFDSDTLGVNLDVGHAVVIGENPAEIIRNFANAILNIHVEDIRQRRHHHLIPGDGDMNFQAIFRALDEISYKGFLTVELYTYRHSPVEAGKKAFAFLSDFLKR